jgi:hypothetical protein
MGIKKSGSQEMLLIFSNMNSVFFNFHCELFPRSKFKDVQNGEAKFEFLSNKI